MKKEEGRWSSRDSLVSLFFPAGAKTDQERRQEGIIMAQYVNFSIKYFSLAGLQVRGQNRTEQQNEYNIYAPPRLGIDRSGLARHSDLVHTKRNISGPVRRDDLDPTVSLTAHPGRVGVGASKQEGWQTQSPPTMPNGVERETGAMRKSSSCTL